jgi:hypothetical protein
MKKLRLAIDQLTVESFSSTDVPTDRGTVQGNDNTLYVGCAYTTDRFELQCRSVGINCGPTEYYSLTCDATAYKCCNPTGVYLCGSS